MRVLMICTKFSLDETNGWLTNDLAQAYAARGDAVDVVVLDWSSDGPATRMTMEGGRIDILNIPALGLMPTWLPRKLRLLGKWLLASYLAVGAARRAFAINEHDVMLGFSPAIATIGLTHYFARRTSKRALIYWDFFPTHQCQLGMVPFAKLLEPLGRKRELAAITQFNAVGCMSPANIAFFKRYFPEYRGQVGIVPIWGPNDALSLPARATLRPQFGFAADNVVAVFGGQLTRGRGLEQLLSLMEELAVPLPHLRCVIAGDGPMAATLRAHLEGNPNSNITYLGKLSRTHYLALLGAADIGLVCTTPHLTVPTFPSKSIDYFRTRLPIFAAVEQAGDYGSILENDIGGGLAAAAEDRDQMAEKLTQLVTDAALRARCAEAGHAYYVAHLTADKALENLDKLL